jgi:hypothetical protein
MAWFHREQRNQPGAQLEFALTPDLMNAKAELADFGGGSLQANRRLPGLWNGGCQLAMCRHLGLGV